MIESIWRDIRGAWRRAIAAPVFAVTALLTLMIGIGANVAVFSAVRGALFRQQPITRPAELVKVSWFARDNPVRRLGLSYAEFVDVRERQDLFSAVFASQLFRQSMAGMHGPFIGLGQMVSEDYFAGLGVTAQRGRTLGAADQEPASAAVAVVSDAFWRRHLDGREDAIGQTITVGLERLTVVGVAPAGFMGLYAPGVIQEQVWVPLALHSRFVNDPALIAMKPGALDRRVAGFLTDRSQRDLDVRARLQPGINYQTARAAFAGMSRGLSDVDPVIARDATLELRPDGASGISGLDAKAPPAVMAVIAMVAIVLLVACANLAGMLLSRGLSRASEIAVRASLGASRGRLVRELMVDNVVLSLAGCALALLAAKALIAPMTALNPPDMPGIPAISIAPQLDMTVLAASFALSALTAFIFGLPPSLRASRTDITRALGAEAVSTPSYGGRWSARSVLVVLQIAASTVLLMIAGGFVQNFFQSRSHSIQATEDHVALLGVDLRVHRYDQRQGRRLLLGMQTYVSADGRAEFTWANALPVGILPRRAVMVESRQGHAATAGVITADERIFRVLGIPILNGRGFDERDDENGRAVALVSEAAAQRWWPGQDPIGKRIVLQSTGKEWIEVIGVAGNTRSDQRDGGAEVIYRPFTQAYASAFYFIMKGRGTGEQSLQALRNSLGAVDPNIAVVEATTLRGYLRRVTYVYWLGSVVLSLLGCLALILATIGLYGVLSYQVTQRTREIGIRSALGATAEVIMLGVVGQGLRVSSLGCSVGLALAFATSRLLRRFMGEFASPGPLVFVGVPLTLIVIAIFASYVPARRAARVQPMDALRVY